MIFLGNFKSLIFGLKIIEIFLLKFYNICDLILFYSDVNKLVFDWCKEGNVKKMDVLFIRENINSKDE